MLEGIANTLAAVPEITVIGTASSADEALALADNANIDVMLLDISIPGGGIEAAYSIGVAHPNLKIVMLTVSERPSHVTAALEAGAKGYVLKGVGGIELIRAINVVFSGRTYLAPELAALLIRMPSTVAQVTSSQRKPQLTSRESNIAKLLANGHTNKEIADALDLTEKTIKHYMTNIFQKLGVRNRVEAVLAIQAGKRV